jgi:hypothetical protein
VGVKRAMVVLGNQSGLPVDSVVNTWHFSPESTDGDIALALRAFYMPASGTSVGQYISNRISRSSSINKIKIYDLDDPKPREAYEDGLTLPAASTTTGDLPHELACCLSYYATRNLKRQRGRIYLGPFHTGALTTGVAGADTSVNLQLRDAIKTAAQALLANLNVTWVVYSPTDNMARDVTAGWVDSAFDIQRRRGAKAVSRLTW